MFCILHSLAAKVIVDTLSIQNSHASHCSLHQLLNKLRPMDNGFSQRVLTGENFHGIGSDLMSFTSEMLKTPGKYNT